MQMIASIFGSRTASVKSWSRSTSVPARYTSLLKIFFPGTTSYPADRRICRPFSYRSASNRLDGATIAIELPGPMPWYPGLQLIYGSRRLFIHVENYSQAIEGEVIVNLIYHGAFARDKRG